MTQAPQLRPLGAALGTEALGIDLSTPLEAGTFAWIQAAFAEHPVLSGIRTWARPSTPPSAAASARRVPTR